MAQLCLTPHPQDTHLVAHATVEGKTRNRQNLEWQTSAQQMCALCHGIGRSEASLLGVAFSSHHTHTRTHTHIHIHMCTHLSIKSTQIAGTGSSGNARTGHHTHCTANPPQQHTDYYTSTTDRLANHHPSPHFTYFLYLTNTYTQCPHKQLR